MHDMTGRGEGWGSGWRGEKVMCDGVRVSVGGEGGGDMTGKESVWGEECVCVGGGEVWVGRGWSSVGKRK